MLSFQIIRRIIYLIYSKLVPLICSIDFLVSYINKIEIFSNKSIKIVYLMDNLTFLLVIFLFIWLIINIKNKQLQRDILSLQLSNFLQVSPSEEDKDSIKKIIQANKYIKKLRIVNEQNKLQVIIPCGNKNEIKLYIESLINDDINIWLQNNIPNTNWKKPKTHYNTFQNKIIVSQK